MVEDSDLAYRLRTIQQRIRGAEDMQRELERAFEEIDHEARRIADRLERAGGSDRSAEGERRRLHDRRRANERDHARNEDRLKQLRAEEKALHEQIGTLRNG